MHIMFNLVQVMNKLYKYEIFGKQNICNLMNKCQAKKKHRDSFVIFQRL